MKVVHGSGIVLIFGFLNWRQKARFVLLLCFCLYLTRRKWRKARSGLGSVVGCMGIQGPSTLLLCDLGQAISPLFPSFPPLRRVGCTTQSPRSCMALKFLKSHPIFFFKKGGYSSQADSPRAHSVPFPGSASSETQVWVLSAVTEIRGDFCICKQFSQLWILMIWLIKNCLASLLIEFAVQEQE